MKLYKADISNQIGNKVITVPTDSQFLIGLSYHDPEATIKLFDGDTEIQAEADKVNAYTCFRFSTDGTPSRKLYHGIVTGADYSNSISILVICQKMSVAYRDMEGEELTSIDFNEVTPINAPWQTLSSRVTSLTSESTDEQFPSAKCVYDIVGDVETLINSI